METSANFIPLGDFSKKSKFDSPAQNGGSTEGNTFGLRAVGETKEERKRIAREFRLAVRKEKKKIKSDAKKQRKQNAIMHRRLTRNNEKYVKNTDRNRQRAIDLERNRIRFEAVKQAERLASIHDPTGKLFNVGEVVIMSDGKVKAKSVLERAAEQTRMTEEALKAKAEAGPSLEGMNPERLSALEGPSEQKKKNMSKKQQKLMDKLSPKIFPPKPVIPEGYSLPDHEENMIELWDLTDEEILRRLSKQKSDQKNAAKLLRKAQQEKKKFNKAMKALKKEAGNKGIMWDPEAARLEVLGKAKYLLPESGDEKEKDGSDSDSDSDSESSSGSDSDSEGGAEVEWESDDGIKEQAVKPVEKSKKRTTSTAAQDAVYTKNFPNRPKINLNLFKEAEEKERQLKETKRAKKDARKAARKAAQAKAEEEARLKAEQEAESKSDESGKDTEIADAPSTEPESKKRKRDDDIEGTSKKHKRRHDDKEGQLKKDKRRKKGPDNSINGEELRLAALKREEKMAKKAAKKARRCEEVAAPVAPVVTVVVSNDDRLDALIAERNQAAASTSGEVDPAPIKKSKKEKKEKKSKDVEVEAEVIDLTEVDPAPINKSKKEKKEKKSKVVEVEAEVIDLTEETSRSEKKRKRSKTITEEEESSKSEKKSKKEKKAKKEEASAANGHAGAEQWNPDALNGDDARKDKFLRLLGAGKAGVNGAANGEKKREGGNVDEIRRAEQELERQFQAGVKMKHDGGGKRRGLGA